MSIPYKRSVLFCEQLQYRSKTLCELQYRYCDEQPVIQIYKFCNFTALNQYCV